MAFKIMAFLGLDGTQFESKLKSEENNAKSFADKVTGIFKGGTSGLLSQAAGGIGAGALFYEVNQSADALVDKFKEISQGAMLLNVDPNTFQRINTVTAALGGSSEMVAKAMEHIAIAQEKVRSKAEGSDKIVSQFNQLGISLNDIEKSDYQHIFFKLADGMKEAEVTGAKLAALHEVLGKEGHNLIPTFRVGFDSSLASKGLIGDEDLARIGQLKKELSEASGYTKGIGLEFGMWATRLKLGFLSLPSSIADMFNPKARTSDGVNTAIRQQLSTRIEAINTERSAKQEVEQKERIERAKNDKEEKKRHAEKLEHDRKESQSLHDQLEKAEGSSNKRKRAKTLFGEITDLMRSAVSGPEGEEARNIARKKALELLSLGDSLKTGLKMDKPLDDLAKIGGFMGGVDGGVSSQLGSIKLTLEDINRWQQVIASAVGHGIL